MNSFEDIKKEVQAVTSKIVLQGNAYIVCDIHSRFSIFLVNPHEDYELRLKDKLIGITERIVVIDKEGYIYNDINHPDYLPPYKINEHTFYVDRHIGLQNWDLKNKFVSNTPIIAFYSFKGGLGRTTSLVLTAIQLARQGKKVALLDFDLEAPGLATLFSNDFPDIEQFKGVTDYIVDTMALKSQDKNLIIGDYYYNINKQDIVGNLGGELMVFPAALIGADENTYLSKFSKVNATFQSNQVSPIDLLLTKIEQDLKPDFILIDTRTGLNDLGGLFLTRYATQSFLFFYGNRQNMFGLESILPKLKQQDLKFYLVNSPVPASPLAEDERSYFLQNSYNLFSDLYYEDETPYINDETALHYPIEVPYNNLAVLLNNTDKLKALVEENSGNNVYKTFSLLINNQKQIIDENEDKNPELCKNLLEGLQSISPEGSSAAEYEFKTYNDLVQKFYPRKDYKFIFDRNKYLILGEKGAGKTALYAVLSNKEFAIDLAIYCEINDSEMQSTTWIKGLDKTPDYPSESVFESITMENEKTLRNFWKLLLIKSIEENMAGKPIQEDWKVFINEAKTIDSLDVDQRIKFIYTLLESEDKYITIIYDYLDVLIREESNTRGKILSALVDVWRGIQTYQTRLSTKIFMRNDIFEREVSLTDKVKLNNHISTISWDYDQLLNIVWKRLWQTQKMPEWMKTLIEEKAESVGRLGIIPELTENDNRKLLERLLGQYMGGNNKAFPYNWILYHISDTKKQIQPRSLLNLFSEAARIQISNKDFEGEYPIRPSSMEMAMPKVSRHRVQDIKEEYPILKAVFDLLSNYHQQFPIEESALETALTKLVGVTNDLKTIPIPEIKKRLEDIGVLYEYRFTPKNKEKRYHIPDLYLIGMGLKRKGPGAHKALFGKK